MIYDLLIVGGGAAGLFAGAGASLSGLEFCLLEGMNQCGLKLLASGSGQCNLTRAGDIRDFPEKYGPAFRFVKHTLMDFDNRRLVTFFQENGLPCEDRGDGKIFPVSRNSRDVRDLLLKLCRIKGKIMWKQQVLSIENQGGSFTVKTGSQNYHAKKVLLAAGGQSYPGTGSTGSAYALAEALGHSIVPPRPALTPVFIRNFPLVPCSGTALPVSVTLFRNGKKNSSFAGDILITHKGFSGPVILNNSWRMEDGDELRISWTGLEKRERIEKDILERIQSSGKKSAVHGLARRELTEGLLKILLERSGIDGEKKMSQLSRTDRQSHLNILTEDRYIIGSKGGFNQAMVTAGGVSLSEVNPGTMESRICRGLYFAGEILDVDGETGGYNLQFAFSSAALAVKSLLSSPD